MSDSALDFLGRWFATHCDGDWEHDLGIRIETLDNPGWALNVRIEGTELQGAVADWHRTEENADQWIHWRSTGVAFEARCGPWDLIRALAAFQAFAESRGPRQP